MVGVLINIVIFGEVIPQSVCVRYGLSIGAYMAPFVLGLMWLLAPIAWPTARLLDKLLGEDHGTVYKKSGLKTLVTLHKTLGSSPTERLNQDEVTIISAVLDLKDKAVGDIMTPMNDVFTMSSDTVLDEKTMDIILSAGYSRIPIYVPGDEYNFCGMLLVKILITYDPEDCKKVSEFALATLPETKPDTSCLDIVNFFQEGKSHMVLVSSTPGENTGALGVVTLEDVIEELIGEYETPLTKKLRLVIDIIIGKSLTNPMSTLMSIKLSVGWLQHLRRAHSMATSLAILMSLFPTNLKNTSLTSPKAPLLTRKRLIQSTLRIPPRSLAQAQRRPSCVGAIVQATPILLPFVVISTICESI
jgi:Mg2+/Co2+ transporter CorB